MQQPLYEEMQIFGKLGKATPRIYPIDQKCSMDDKWVLRNVFCLYFQHFPDPDSDFWSGILLATINMVQKIGGCN